MQKKWHETCKCKCRLDTSVCNNKQRWNDDKCRYECKELIDKGVCDKGYIWNPSNCECESDKSCDVGEYLDCKNCKCRKKLADKLVEKCTKNIVEVKIASENEHKNKCSSWHCILCWFRYYLQLLLELVLILFTTNTLIVIKKLPLDMIIINKINRSLYIIWLLEEIANNSNKYCIFGLTFQIMDFGK